jgi:hypothetical protein
MYDVIGVAREQQQFCNVKANTAYRLQKCSRFQSVQVDDVKRQSLGLGKNDVA